MLYPKSLGSLNLPKSTLSGYKRQAKHAKHKEFVKQAIQVKHAMMQYIQNMQNMPTTQGGKKIKQIEKIEKISNQKYSKDPKFKQISKKCNEYQKKSFNPKAEESKKQNKKIKKILTIPIM